MTSNTFDAAQFKAQFPALKNQAVHYLDNAATTQKPSVVIEAIRHYYQNGVGNAHRGSHRYSRDATKVIESCRQSTADFINAEHSDNIVFTQSCTAALNTLAKGIGEQLQAGDEIILSLLEHHANLLPWQEVAKNKGLVLKFLPLHNGELDIDQLKTLITDNTRVVSLSACSNTLGCAPDLHQARQIIPESCVFVVDAAQHIAHNTVDVQQIGCDFLCFSAHKMYGPEGLGVLYGKRSKLNKLTPLLTGGGMIQQVGLEESSYLEAPHRFEAGSPATAAIAGFQAALDFFGQWPLEHIKHHKQTLCHHAHQGLKQLNEIQLFSDPHNPAGIVCFSLQEQELNIELADFLDRHGISVRQGHHCTQPLLQSMNQSSLLRASIAPYNTREDMDALLRACEAFLQNQKHIKQTPSDAPAKKELNAQRAKVISGKMSWQQRQKQLILWGKEITIKADIRKERYMIPGCESALWLHAKRRNGFWNFRHDSDARLIRGVSALILSWVEGCRSEEIKAFDFNKAIEELQLENYLSPSRSNGIHSLINHLRNLP
ncbi:aminotransferase class V-fold PLP-dependent enzyme [Pseudoteredinibacter isoporae]|uniref:cysteine desulfurase n=1 Tax=Pseudoteredinibacter isoporae TaxID=570281 RepID=A0A7X0JRY3_9GAMM|nr:aminotransferase class V-fold PLP-dependent enzyme [Pseudoteredinibacter isoporae]MBB6521184.1 SufS family cysteine desulfurase [Pseudoteredinibacter isoporae]NHO86744.1 aminotransferase class V-fold PLP-dependent enzyme [Pseudoteredinibacter isoporae]NIB24804.1 aminotransferase class V-fold PLP-dependent enzyme [Pseudoteredinibacter isoporae]